jgi:hypothetical protein
MRPNPRFKGQWVAVTSEGCGAAIAAKHGTGGGTAGAIVIAARVAWASLSLSAHLH